ncbi:hypothetical protein NA57DRAFT_29906 [Rhizodiscina lignyota]|uniref:2-dehydropantoate 2-reductase n=1 Tax=Rhizodiscina lignyota TaxID=1504668 RepID=A0A9P4IPZ4_9PEZI|nr:hypothetical protein NA57DRAFT_29906 [Rhizodiscina lignyota]
MDPPSETAYYEPLSAPRPPKIVDPPEQAARRIHILGTGSIGILIAHSLRGISNPPAVTLLMHRVGKARQWLRGSEEIKLVTQGQTEARSGFDWEYAIPMWRRHGRAEKYHERIKEAEEPSHSEEFSLNATSPISNLIVSVKAQQTVSALLSIKARLTPQSTILFMQNGMGIIDEVNKEVFPDPESRPHYMLGINSHGVHSQQDFVATHAGFGTIALGLPPRPSRPPSPTGEESTAFSGIEMAPSSRYLLRTLSSVPVLAAVGFAPIELFKAQLEKLAMNSILNPLTALMDCRNGALLYNFANTRTMRLLLSEISSVYIRLPELEGLPNVNTRFSSERLETLVVGVANKTAANVSSMLADIRAGRQTEIDYINGYVVKRGEELGITAGFNYMLCQLVKGKQNIVQRDDDESVPFVTKR